MSAPVVSLRDVSAGYKRRAAVHHVSFACGPGALVALVGPNGAGKTTLLRAIAGEAPLMSGVIDRPRGARIGYMPQHAAVDLSFPLDVRSFVTAGLWRGHGLFGAPDRGQRDRVEAAIESVGLAGFEQRPLRTLSAGQAQRMLFARLMTQDADVLLLDEPFSAIDSATASRLLDTLARLAGEGRTIIAAVHDLEAARERFDNAILLARELIAYGAPCDALSPENLLRARRLSEAWRNDAAFCGTASAA